MSKKPGRKTPEPARSPSVAARERAAASELTPGLKIKVKVTHTGYYGEKRRREDDVFIYTVDAKAAKTGQLPKWMVRVPANTPQSITTGKEELRKKHDEIIRARMPAEGSTLADDELMEGQESPFD